MSTRRHAFASMGRRAAALAACVALVAGLAPWTPARAEEAASATAPGAASESPAQASQPTTLTAQSLTAQASVGDVFTGKITVGGTDVDCKYKVLSLPEGANPGTVQVGNGSNAAIVRSASGALAIPATVDYGTETYRVTALGDHCFEACGSLTSTGLGSATSAVASLGDSCFYGCTSLTDTGLAGNTKVTSLGGYCFEGCGSLTSTGLTDNAKLTSLPEGCFDDCRSLEDTGLSKNKNITSLGVSCFEGCTWLTSTGLGSATSAVASLGDSCFYGCTSLTDTGLAGNTKVTSLGGYCFYSCTSLTGTGLTDNEKLTSLPEGCFDGCTSLEDTGLSKNKNITSLGVSCFEGCTWLTSTGLGSDTSAVTSLDSDCFSGCTSLTDTGLGTNTNLTTLPKRSFFGCTSLAGTGLATNTKVTSLGYACFAICDKLTDTGLATNSAVTALGEKCFGACTSLADAALGSSLKSVPDDPFYGCTALATVYFAGSSSSAKGIVLPQGVDCYHLASDATWNGVTASQVSSNCTSLKALSQLAVSGGTYSGSPSNPWKSAIAGETLWAEGETVSVTASQPKTGYKVGWSSSDKDVEATFAGATAQSTTYTFGPSAGQGTTTLTGATPISYKIRFKRAGSLDTMADEDMTYGVAKALTRNAFTRAGYHFLGWYDMPGGTGPVAYTDGQVVSNLAETDGAVVELWAVWAEDDPVTISYASADAAMGTVSTASEQVAPATGTAAGSTATASAGYHLVSWTDASGKEVSASATLVPAKAGGLNVAAAYTANFAGNSYAVAFDANGGTGTMDPEDMAYGVEAALKANALTRTNWSFAGWNTAADGTGTAYADGATVESLTTEAGATVTLFAQWVPARVQTRTYVIDGVEVTATLTGSDKSIDGLVVERRDPSSAVTSALGDRTLQSDWDVHFTDGTTEGFGTLTLAFPAAGGTAQVWEVRSGKLTKGADQAVSNGTVSASVTTLSEFAVTSAPAAPAMPATAAAAATATPTPTPATGDGTSPALPVAIAGSCIVALALAFRRSAE